MKYHQFYLPIAFLLNLGCNQKHFTFSDLDNVDKGIVVNKGRPACEVPEIDYRFNTQVVEFDVTTDNKFNFGFSLIPGFEWFKAFDAKFTLKKSTLTVSTAMSEYLNPLEQLAPATGSGIKKESGGGVRIDLNYVNFGGSTFTSTSFFQVMVSALKDSAKKTVKALQQIESRWNTIVVLKPEGDEIIVPTGRNAGIQVGDQFEVYNVKHRWDGEPCTSKYRMATQTTEEPIAIFYVKSQDDLRPLL